MSSNINDAPQSVTCCFRGKTGPLKDRSPSRAVVRFTHHTPLQWAE